MLSFFLRDVLDKIRDLIGSVSEGFPTYFFIIAMYGVMNYSLLMPNLVAFYAKQNEILKKIMYLFCVGCFSIYARLVKL